MRKNMSEMEKISDRRVIERRVKCGRKGDKGDIDLKKTQTRKTHNI